MKKNRKIIVSLLLIFFIVLTIVPTYVQAAGSDIDEAISGADDFIKDGKANSQSKINADAIKNTSDTIYNILFSIAMIVAVIWASILGIKFMIGSAEEQADIKQALIPFVIGCFVVFSSFGIWKIVVTVLSSLEP